jgi:hypothetical protein
MRILFSLLTTTDAYQLLDGYLIAPAKGNTALLQCWNSGANSATWSVFANADSAVGQQVIIDQAIAAGATSTWKDLSYYAYYTVLAKSTGAGLSTTVVCRMRFR